MAISISFTDKERQLAESYARLHSLTVGEALKKALMEKIEEEHDTILINECYDRYLRSREETMPVSQLWRELDL